MKIRIFSLLACFFLAASLSAQLPSAQRSKDRAQRRAENKVNNKVDRTVDKAVDDIFNGIFGKKRKKTSKTDASTKSGDNSQTTGKTDAEQDQEDEDAVNNAMSSLFGGGDFEAYTNPRDYSFAFTITTTKRNGKTETMDASIAVIETKTAMSMVSKDGKKTNQVRNIFDTQTGKTTMIMTDKDGQTTATRMRMPNVSGMVNQELENEDFSTRMRVNRTGERRTIDGYDCEKIVATDTKTGDVTTAWVTKEIELTWEDVSRGIMAMAGGGNQVSVPGMADYTDELGGLMIEGTTVTAKGETVVMHYQDFRVDGRTDKSLFNLDGIEVTDLGF